MTCALDSVPPPASVGQPPGCRKKCPCDPGCSCDSSGGDCGCGGSGCSDCQPPSPVDLHGLCCRLWLGGHCYGSACPDCCSPCYSANGGGQALDPAAEVATRTARFAPPQGPGPGQRGPLAANVDVKPAKWNVVI